MNKILLSSTIAAFLTCAALPFANAQELELNWYENVQKLLDQGQNAAAKDSLRAHSESTSDAEERIRATMALAQIALSENDWENYDALVQNLEQLFDNSPRIAASWRAPYQYLMAQSQRLRGEEDKAQNTLRLLQLELEEQNKKRATTQWLGLVAFERALLLSHDNPQARKLADLAIDSFQSTKNASMLGYSLILLAKLEWERDKTRRAYNLYNDAIRAFRQDASSGESVVRTHVLVAKRLASEGRIRAAQQRIALAEQVLEVLGTNDALRELIDNTQLQLQNSP
ncbi:MAG: hypothetical protein WC966_03960 [Bradymonadales bacterium]